MTHFNLKSVSVPSPPLGFFPDNVKIAYVVLAPFCLFLVKDLVTQMVLELKLTIKDYNTPHENCFGGLFQHHKNPSILWQS